jgi:hypothetical protein
MAAASCGSPASTSSSAGVTSQDAHVSAAERRAVLAFSGTYQVRSVVTGATGSYGESVGSVHIYTWQAVPDCGSRSCVVRVTSSTGSHTVFTYSNGEFHGVGSGSATCYNLATGDPIGNDATSLADTLTPVASTSPITRLTGDVKLTASGTCGNGTGTFRYTLTRAGTGPSTA